MRVLPPGGSHPAQPGGPAAQVDRQDTAHGGSSGDAGAQDAQGGQGREGWEGEEGEGQEEVRELCKVNGTACLISFQQIMRKHKSGLVTLVWLLPDCLPAFEQPVKLSSSQGSRDGTQLHT